MCFVFRLVSGFLDIKYNLTLKIGDRSVLDLPTSIEKMKFKKELFTIRSNFCNCDLSIIYIYTHVYI